MERHNKADNRIVPASGQGSKPSASGTDGPVACLRVPGIGSSVLRLKKKDPVFYQSMPADCVFYLLKGRVKLTAVSAEGKEATIALLRAGDFLHAHIAGDDKRHEELEELLIPPQDLMKSLAVGTEYRAFTDGNSSRCAYRMVCRNAFLAQEISRSQ